jgi:hypothetical protein
MRVVGNTRWCEFAATHREAMERGQRLDDMARFPEVPDFQPRGVFRGMHAYFMAMDEAKEQRRQAWFRQHAQRPA